MFFKRQSLISREMAYKEAILCLSKRLGNKMDIYALHDEAEHLIGDFDFLPDNIKSLSLNDFDKYILNPRIELTFGNNHG